MSNYLLPYNTGMMPQANSISTLSNDDILIILRDISFPSLLRLRQVSQTSKHPVFALVAYISFGYETCRKLDSFSRSKSVWLNQYHNTILSQNMAFPPYWKGIDLFSPSQLENLVAHYSKLNMQLCDPRRRCPLKSIPFHRTHSVTWVRLVQSQWILVASSDDISSSIALWLIDELGSGAESPITEAFISAPVSSGMVDVE